MTTGTEAPDLAAAARPCDASMAGGIAPAPFRPWRALRPLSWSVSLCLLGCAVMLLARMVMAINEAVLEANPTLDPANPDVWWISPDAYGAWTDYLQLPLLGLTALGVISWSWRLYGTLVRMGELPGFPRHRLVWMWWVPGIQLWWPWTAFATLRRQAWLAAARRRVGVSVVATWWGFAVAGLLASIAAQALAGDEELGLWLHLLPGGLLMMAAMTLLLIVEDVQRALRRAG